MLRSNLEQVRESLSVLSNWQDSIAGSLLLRCVYASAHVTFMHLWASVGGELFFLRLYLRCHRLPPLGGAVV